MRHYRSVGIFFLHSSALCSSVTAINLDRRNLSTGQLNMWSVIFPFYIHEDSQFCEKLQMCNIFVPKLLLLVLDNVQYFLKCNIFAPGVGQCTIFFKMQYFCTWCWPMYNICKCTIFVQVCNIFCTWCWPMYTTPVRAAVSCRLH